jgi:hypothetical protein
LQGRCSYSSGDTFYVNYELGDANAARWCRYASTITVMEVTP